MNISVSIARFSLPIGDLVINKERLRLCGYLGT